MRHSFLLSLLLHVLLIGGFTTILILEITPIDKYKKPPQLYIPSFVYKAAITPTLSSPAQKSATQPSVPEKSLTKIKEPNVTKSKYGLTHQHKKSFMDMSRDILRQDQVQQTFNNLAESEPILLIGDKNELPDPLLKLLGRALSANFNYPKLEGSLGVRGRTIVSMVLHPEGYFTNVQLVKSSDNPHFDMAAIYAVNKAPRIEGISKLLLKPKYFIVGFIFN